MLSDVRHQYQYQCSVADSTTSTTRHISSVRILILRSHLLRLCFVLVNFLYVSHHHYFHHHHHHHLRLLISCHAQLIYSGEYSPGNSPGAAAPGINDANLLVYHYSGLVQPIGLVDYLSLKKSI